VLTCDSSEHVHLKLVRIDAAPRDRAEPSKRKAAMFDMTNPVVCRAFCSGVVQRDVCVGSPNGTWLSSYKAARPRVSRDQLPDGYKGGSIARIPSGVVWATPSPEAGWAPSGQGPLGSGRGSGQPPTIIGQCSRVSLLSRSMGDEKPPTPADRDEPVKLDLDPELVLRALLKVDPDELVPQDEPLKDQGDKLGE
jgi:hypothetical protein